MSDLKHWDVYKDPLWLLHNLYKKYKVIRVPTNAGWISSLVNSGALTQVPFLLGPHTGVTANSRGLAYATTLGLNSGTLSRSYIDWTKWLELSFILLRLNSDAEAVGRFQLKEIGTEGILANQGIGIQATNYALVGEAYGTARGTVSLGNLTDDRSVKIKIVKKATSVEFWVNDVLTDILTGTAVPAVAGTAAGYSVASIINGGTGTVDGYLFVGNIQVIQEW